MVENREELIAAVNNDYGTRSRFETSLSELLSMQVGVLETIRHLKVWMKPRNRHLKALDFMLKVKSYTPSKGKIMEEHDLVVVGGGRGGCVRASAITKFVLLSRNVEVVGARTW